MIGLIDGDGFVYRAGFGVEKTEYLVECGDGGFWHPETLKDLRDNEDPADIVWTRKVVGEYEEALAKINGYLSNAIKDADITEPFVYLTPVAGNFRDTVGTVRKYKGNRDEHIKPVYYSELRHHLVRNWDAKVVVGIEADDYVSVLARYHQSRGREVVVVGQDKDLYQIPGLHYNWVNGDRIQLSEYDARAWFWTQVLCGDSGDNIVGCYRVGPTKARTLVQGQTDLSDSNMWPIVLREYEKSIKLSGCPYSDKRPEDVALEMARLVRLNTMAYEKNLWIPEINKEVPVGEKEIIQEIRKSSSAQSVSAEGESSGSPATA